MHCPLWHKFECTPSKDNDMMFYEGAEKRLEICTATINLLDFPHVFWEAFVKQAGATILSTMQHHNSKAFLLSESSLFLWPHKLLLITCGDTSLLNAALFFLQQATFKEVTSLLFQRHQTLRPEKQKSQFIDDCAILNLQLSGEIKVLQKNYSGALYQHGQAPLANATQQILMLHQLKSDLIQRLQKGGLSTRWINNQLRLKHFFPQFNIDAFSFDPRGYSVNAIANDHYFTLHITPEKLSTYLSFESNLKSALLTGFFAFLDTLFKPKKHCLLQFY